MVDHPDRSKTTAEAAAPCECGKTTWIECAERPRRECGLWDKKRPDDHGANSQTTFPCTMCWRSDMKTLTIALLASSLALPAVAQTFESDTGAKIRITGAALASKDSRGNKEMVVSLVDDDGRTHRVFFECSGNRYGTLEEGIWHHTPPRSVLAQVQRSVCK
jgi:hypothetical protein